MGIEGVEELKPGEPPVRICCGARHYGVQCPSGLVMCCICFHMFTVDGLCEEDGVKINVCKECKEKEQTINEKKGAWVVYDYDINAYPIFMTTNELVAHRYREKQGHGYVKLWPYNTEWKDIDMPSMPKVTLDPDNSPK